MKLIKHIATTVALAVGFTAGFYAVEKVTKREGPELRRLGESVAYTQPLYRQYREGDHARAKAAMLEVVRHLDEYEAESARRGADYALSNEDAMMAYVRLAKVEEKHGGTQAREFMREAVARCERLKGRGEPVARYRRCEEPYLRDQADRLDANIK